jgi:hypothetical protein
MGEKTGLQFFPGWLESQSLLDNLSIAVMVNLQLNVVQ